MKPIILCILFLTIQACTHADAAPQERWILLGDSLQSQVHEVPGVTAQSRHLTANRIPQEINISIQNISTPGLTMANNGTLWNAHDNREFLHMLDGYFGAKGIIITLGTNDWSTPGITTGMFYDQYSAVVSKAKSLGMVVVCVTPIWRADKDQYMPSGSSSYQLWVYQWIAATACQNQGEPVIDGSTAPLAPSHFTDGLHLNGAGHAVFSSWLIQQMQAIGYWHESY